MFPETVAQDLSHGIRVLARNPGSTFLAVFALAAGIGINTAVYTAYKAMVARPLDAREPSTMVNLALKRGSGHPQWSFSYPDYEALRGSMHSVSGLIAFRPSQLTFSEGRPDRAARRPAPAGATLGRLGLLRTNSAGAADFASVMMVSANYFQVLVAGLRSGRDFESIGAEELLKNPAVLISENY